MKKLISFIILFSCVIFSFLSCNCWIRNEDDIFCVGNTNGNIHNLGTVVEDDEWIYYSEPRTGYLTRIKRSGEGNKEYLRKVHSYNLNLISGNIYYIKGEPGKVYKYNIEEKNLYTILNDYARDLIVTNKYIFYIYSPYNDENGRLYRTDLDGKNELLLANKVGEFAVSENFVYYIDLENEEAVYRSDINGEKKEKIVDTPCIFLELSDDSVYFTDINDFLYRKKFDGVTEKISENKCKCINLQGEYIYYLNKADEYSIWRVRKDGNEEELLVDYRYCNNINIVDDNLFFYTSLCGEYIYYISDLNGKNINIWE